MLVNEFRSIQALETFKASPIPTNCPFCKGKYEAQDMLFSREHDDFICSDCLSSDYDEELESELLYKD